MFSCIYIATIILVYTKQICKYEIRAQNRQQGEIIFIFNNFIDHRFSQTLVSKYNEYKI